MGTDPRVRNCALKTLAHQNRTITIARDFRVDGAKSPEIPQKKGALGSEIAARNRKSLATFHRTLKSQCSTAFSCLGDRQRFLGSAMGIAIANRKNRCHFGALSSRLSGGATEPSQPDLPLWTRPPPNPSPRPGPDPTLTCFDPFRTRKGGFQVRIRSKSAGPDQIRGEGFGGGRVQRGRSGWERSVAPRKVLTVLSKTVFGPFPIFGSPKPRVRGNAFETFLDFGLKGQDDNCKWSTTSQHYPVLPFLGFLEFLG